MVKHRLDTEHIFDSFLDQGNISPRYERKFRMSINRSTIINGYLEQLGFFKEHPQRVVKTLYFDTNNFKFAKDNIDGVRHRIKPRLRWYNDLSSITSSETKLEYKLKDGFLGYKFSNKSSLSDASDLIENRLGVIGFPKIETSYNRIYLINSDGVRATIDTNISARVFSNSFKPSYNLDYEVLEFKYGVNLDQYFRQILFKYINKLPLLRLNKSSKYIEGLLHCQSEL